MVNVLLSLFFYFASRFLNETFLPSNFFIINLGYGIQEL